MVYLYSVSTRSVSKALRYSTHYITGAGGGILCRHAHSLLFLLNWRRYIWFEIACRWCMQSWCIWTATGTALDFWTSSRPALSCSWSCTSSPALRNFFCLRSVYTHTYIHTYIELLTFSFGLDCEFLKTLNFVWTGNPFLNRWRD